MRCPPRRRPSSAFARFCGYETGEAFEAEVRRTLECVQGHYSRLFESAEELGTATGSLVFTGGEDDPETIETLSRMGYHSPSEVSATIRGWHFGRYAATRSAQGARAADGADAEASLFARRDGRRGPGLPRLRPIPGRASGGGAAVLAAEGQSAPPRSSGHHPRQRAAPCRAAEPQAQGAGRGARPRLLHLAALGSRDGAADRSRHAAGAANSTRWRTAPASSARNRPSASACACFRKRRVRRRPGLAFSQLAGLLLGRLHAAVTEDAGRRYGRVPGGRSAVIAMGKLGGREMTAGSDLDLIIVYDAAPGAEASEGAKPLSINQYYARLTQRLISAVSAPTAEGVLYEVDMRLRPSGSKGPVAASLASFDSYHHGSAWTWEKLALTRARPVCGDPGLMDGTLRQDPQACWREPRDAATGEGRRRRHAPAHDPRAGLGRGVGREAGAGRAGGARVHRPDTAADPCRAPPGGAGHQHAGGPRKAQRRQGCSPDGDYVGAEAGGAALPPPHPDAAALHRRALSIRQRRFPPSTGWSPIPPSPRTSRRRRRCWRIPRPRSPGSSTGWWARSPEKHCDGILAVAPSFLQDNDRRNVR